MHRNQTECRRRDQTIAGWRAGSVPGACGSEQDDGHGKYQATPAFRSHDRSSTIS
jgi:hypothetical protein